MKKIFLVSISLLTVINAMSMQQSNLIINNEHADTKPNEQINALLQIIDDYSLQPENPNLILPLQESALNSNLDLHLLAISSEQLQALLQQIKEEEKTQNS